jgi:hypothetical protein
MTMAFSHRITPPSKVAKKGKGGRCVNAEKDRHRRERETELVTTLAAGGRGKR